MSIPKLSVSNPVLANLLMIVIIIFGVYAWIVLPRELTPEISFNSATVTTFYPGASSEDVEKLVTVPIEDAIEENVNKIDIVLSVSSEGRSLITVQFEEGRKSTNANLIKSFRTCGPPWIESMISRLKFWTNPKCRNLIYQPVFRC